MSVQESREFSSACSSQWVLVNSGPQGWQRDAGRAETDAPLGDAHSVADVAFNHVSKVYPDGTRAVSGMDLGTRIASTGQGTMPEPQSLGPNRS
jgi:hypothetical protein